MKIKKLVFIPFLLVACSPQLEASPVAPTQASEPWMEGGAPLVLVTDNNQIEGAMATSTSTPRPTITPTPSPMPKPSNPLSDEVKNSSMEEYLARLEVQELLAKPENVGLDPWEVVLEDIRKDVEAITIDSTADTSFDWNKSDGANVVFVTPFGRVIDVVSYPMDDIPGATGGSTAHLLMIAHSEIGAEVFPFLVAIEKNNGQFIQVVSANDYIADQYLDFGRPEDLEDLIGKRIKLFLNYYYLEPNWDVDSQWSQWGNGIPKDYYVEVHDILKQSHYLEWMTKNIAWINVHYSERGLTQLYSDMISGNVTIFDGETVSVLNPDEGDFALLGPVMGLP